MTFVTNGLDHDTLLSSRACCPDKQGEFFELYIYIRRSFMDNCDNIMDTDDDCEGVDGFGSGWMEL